MMAHRDQIAGSAASRSSIPRLPNRPPFAPVAPIRVAASCGVSHVMLRQTITVQPHKPNDPQVEHTYLVPGLLTRGSATHCNEEAHEERANLSPTHCASWPLTHAVSPVEHVELVVSPWNLRLRACASRPFWSVNAARRSTLARLPNKPPLAPVAPIRASASSGVSHVTLRHIPFTFSLSFPCKRPPQQHVPGSGLVD